MPNEALNLIGPVVRRLRAELRLSQPKLAARLQLDGWDVDRDFIAKVEGGTRLVRDKELVKFAASLGVTPDFLLAEAYALQVRQVREHRDQQAGKSGPPKKNLGK